MTRVPLLPSVPTTLLCNAVVFTLLTVAPIWAQSTSQEEKGRTRVEGGTRSSKSDRKQAKADQEKEESPEVSAALAFIREHHPEMVPLLDLLRAMNPKQFDAAIKDCNRVRIRLEQLKSKGDGAYEPELGLWKIQSQINLHVAKLVGIEHDFEKDRDLRDLLEQQRKLQLRVLELEQARIQKRMDQIKEQIDGADLHADEWIASQLSKVSKKVASQSSRSKKKLESAGSAKASP